MIEVAKLSVSRVFIFKEQTYRGRCLVAYNGHVDDLNLMSDDERNAFMADVANVTRAMQKIFNPAKSTMEPIPTLWSICTSTSSPSTRTVPTSAVCSG